MVVGFILLCVKYCCTVLMFFFSVLIQKRYECNVFFALENRSIVEIFTKGCGP